MPMPCVLALFASAFAPCNFANAVEPPVTAAAFAPDATHVVIGSQTGIAVLSWPQLQSIRTIETDLPNVHDLVFNPAGDRVAAVGGFPAEGGIIEIFDWPSGTRVHKAQVHKDLIYAMAWRADGLRYVTASADGLCRVFDASSHQPLLSFEGHSRPVLSVCYMPDGKTIVSTGIDETLRVWDADSGEQVRSLHNHTSAVKALALRPGAAEEPWPMLASAGSDSTLRLWQPTRGRMVRFAQLDSRPLSAAWTVDGRLVMAACEDGAVHIVDPDTVKIVQTVPAVEGWAYTLAVSPAGDGLLVAGQGGAIRRVSLDLSDPSK